MTHRQRRKAEERQLTQYISNEPQRRLQQRKRRPYKRYYNPAPVTAYKRLLQPVIDNLAIENRFGYQGPLYQIFLSGDLEFFAQWQQEYALTFQKNECRVEDIIRLEIARIRLEFQKN